MGRMIFVGSKTHGYFAQEVATVRNYEFEYIPPKGNIKEQTNDILFISKGKCDYIIFDVEQYINDACDIAEEIVAISTTINAKPIIYIPAFIPDSVMARELVAKDIKSFIVSGTASELKDQLEKNMTGFFDTNERKEIENIIKLQEEEQKQMGSFNTIGVAGACHRIGTTTQAIQIVKYLKFKGYKACMIEMNSNTYSDHDRISGSVKKISFVEKIKAWFDTEELDEDLGMVSCFGVDMFYKQNRINDVLKKGYDYYVYDYGVYTDRDFNKTAFVREDIKFFVVGSFPTELEYTQEVAQNIFYEDAKLIFSLAADEEHDDILMLMDKIKINGKGIGNAERTFFSEYIPDPFAFCNVNLYETLLPINSIENVEEIPKKKSFFRKKKEKKNGK